MAARKASLFPNKLGLIWFNPKSNTFRPTVDEEEEEEEEEEESEEEDALITSQWNKRRLRDRNCQSPPGEFHDQGDSVNQ
jgi:hypothetical protein